MIMCKYYNRVLQCEIKATKTNCFLRKKFTKQKQSKNLQSLMYLPQFSLAESLPQIIRTQKPKKKVYSNK